MSSLAAEECEALRGEIHELVDQTFPALVVPPSPTSALSAALELKAGVGGQEACLFLSDLHRMYMRYSSSRNWKTKVLNVDNADGVTVGGIVVEVQGEGAYDELKWESGVHRIQRVPATEAAGRVHTSTVTVAVSEELESSQVIGTYPVLLQVFPLPVEKDNDPKPVYELKDVKIEFMRARGAGGQVCGNPFDTEGIHFNNLLPARQQDRISRTINASSDRHHRRNSR
jgi:peptide chain release factor 1